MKAIPFVITSMMLAAMVARGQTITWTNMITQTTLPSGPTTFLPGVIGESGEEYATVAVADSQPGLKFQLFTVPSNLDASNPYLLQTTSVGVFPTGRLEIDTEDPYNKEPGTESKPNVTYENPTFASTGSIPTTNPNGKGRRTRVDRPFRVYTTAEGILTGATDPVEAKSVNFYRLVKQGTTVDVSPPQPGITEIGSPLAPITTNGAHEHFPTPADLGGNPRKYIGVQQFSLWSLAENPDPNLPGQKIASAKVEIFPINDGTISGIAMNDTVRFAMPKLTFTYNDVYPGPTNSAVYALLYKGERVSQLVDGVGVIVPGSHKNNSALVLESYVESSVGDLDHLMDSDGRWTIELLSDTPFGLERMQTPSGQPAYVTFNLDRTIEVNSTVTTVE